MAKKYKVVGLGGTFDHFHLGHQKLIDTTAAVADKLLIGITSDIFAKQLEKLFPESLESHFTRLESVKTYCTRQNYQVELFSLSDPFGPTVFPESGIDALCVSSETKKTADQINQKRQEIGLQSLPIIEVPLQLLDSGKVLSSTLVRAGKCSSSGTQYSSTLEKTLVLTESQRVFFSEVQGKLVENPTQKNTKKYVVGDSSLQKFILNNWEYDLAVFDFKVMRKEYEPPVIAREKIDLIATNPAGQITHHMTSVLQAALQKSLRHVFIDGEEDLAAVALVLLAPLDSEIYYGQPNTGLVCLEVTEAKKLEVLEVLSS